jgi:opacity protein-like surface antigen
VKNIILILFLISVTLFSFDFWKGQRGYLPTRALAMAGAQNVCADKTDAAYLNPASLITKDKKYLMSFEGLYNNEELPTKFMASVVDTRSSIVAGGAYISYYNYDDKTSGNKINYSTLEVGLSYAYPIAGGLVAGIGGRYYKFKKSDDTNHAFSVDLGLTYRFSPYVKIGVVAYNLTKLDYPETPFKVVSGISLGDASSFLFNFDLVADFSASEIYENKTNTVYYEYHAGVKFTPTDGLALMGGYEINKVLDDNFWSLGLEWFLPQSRVELAISYLQSTTTSDKNFSFSFGLYF